MAIQNNVSLAGGLFILCVAGYYWGGFGKDTPIVLEDADNLPEYQVSQITGIQINEQGQIVRQIIAKQLQHFAEQDETIIHAPIVMLYQQGQKTWQISATKAISRQDNQWLNLQNQVVAQQLTQTALRLETSSLIAEPQKHLLYTQTPVVVRSPNGEIRSLGLQANTEKGTINFIGQVRGTYVLPTP